MIEFLLIAITLVGLRISIQKVGFLPFPTALIVFFAVSQVMLLLLHNDVVEYGMHFLYDFGGLQENYLTIQALYTSASLLALLSMAGKFKSLKSLSLAGGFSVLLKVKDSSRVRAALIMILLCGIHLSLLWLLSDWSKLWLHQEYLQSYIDDRWLELLGDENTEAVSRTTPLFALLSTFCACSLIGTRHAALRVIASTMSIFYFLLLLSLHSRSAIFVPMLSAIYFTVLDLKGRKIAVPALALVATISLMGALEQRDTNRHGLSTLPETILSPFSSSDPIERISQLLMDFCQGTVVTAESLQLESNFDSKYKMLVFSPLPSFIDGYSSIRPDSEQRLHDYVPMSAVGELYHFGWFYICVLLLGFTLFIRAHISLAAKVPVIFVVCNFLIMFSVYMLFSYPVRNALRFFWVSVFLFIAVEFMLRRRKTKRGVGLAAN